MIIGIKLYTEVVKMIRLGKLLDRMHQVMVVGDNDFRYGKVILITICILSKKLTPFDEESGQQIIRMRLRDESGELKEIDVNKIIGWWWSDRIEVDYI